MVNSYNWLSAYLYSYGLILDDVLEDFIINYLSELGKNIKLVSYFFIRYNDEYGDHIRLRLLIEHLDFETVKFDLENKYRVFYSSREKKNKSLNDIGKLVRFVDYVSEVQRYGGNARMHISEDYFNRSSIIVLDILKEVGIMQYSTKIAIILQLHLIVLFTLCNNKNEIVILVRDIMEIWLPAGFSRIPKIINSSNLSFEEKVDICLNFYLEAYNMDEANIEMLLNEVYYHLTLNQDLENDLLNEWFSSNKIFMNRYSIVTKEMKAYPPLANVVSIPNIYKSLIHMNNNRIGIRNSDEGYIAFILLKFLEKK